MKKKLQQIGFFDLDKSNLYNKMYCYFPYEFIFDITFTDSSKRDLKKLSIGLNNKEGFIYFGSLVKKQKNYIGNLFINFKYYKIICKPYYINKDSIESFLVYLII